MSARLLKGLLVTVGLLGLAPKAGLAAAAPAKPKLVVLDIELTGDLGGPQFTAEHAARLRMESAILRRELEASGLYQVLDNTPALPLINQLTSGCQNVQEAAGYISAVTHVTPRDVR